MPVVGDDNGTKGLLRVGIVQEHRPGTSDVE